ncbi:MAG TPA: RcpC/CpaB family pilus assembly protein [Candidatus Limnocylindria bacterium]|nr:RcpC/CpaB family pilus assembly protein [Candidatus Limnocylindria bacterium]
MIARRTLLVLALLAGITAGVAYWLDTRRVPLIVAARAIESETVLEERDLGTMDVPVDVVPADAVMDRGEALGRTVHARLHAGQLLLRAVLDEAPGFRSGLRPAPGWRAVALPVAPALALGGAIVPGVRVDVVAVPLAGRAPADRGPERLATGLLVLDVRSESGGPFVEPGSRDGSAALANARLGSVIVEVPAEDDLLVAERIATSTFVIFRSR